MNKIIDVKNLTKTYADKNTKVTALDNVSFSLNEGEDLAILGPSGSGKTTLLQLMGGLSKATSGEVIIDGRRVDQGSDKEISQFRNKTIGFVFQLIYLQDYLTASENVMLPMLASGMDRKIAKRRADRLLEKVGLRKRAAHKPNELSGGEMQRVGIARALANNPKIILADEPTGKLDKVNSEKIMSILKVLADKEKVSVIFITHDMEIAKKFGRVIEIKHGRISQEYKNIDNG